jgi:hypothetical protein
LNGGVFIKIHGLSKPEKWLLVGIPILFLIGGFMHFAYGLSGHNVLVGMIAPVNESVFEHMKMVLPLVLWWSIYYVCNGDKYKINKDKWFWACVISLVCSILTIPTVAYTYRSAFGIESVVFDIFILLFALAMGQIIGIHVYRYGKGFSFKISLTIIVLIVILFIVFTFWPPHIPIFQDGNTGEYGRYV